MGRKSGTQTVNRRVAVLMSNPVNTIDLIEVETKVRYTPETDNYRVSKNEAEQLARQRLADKGRDPDEYDFVGVLVSHLHTGANGRITWGEAIETQEAVEV